MFAKLRDWRKATAEQEGIPVYAVLTNEQLAAIATKRPETSVQLRDIEGVGEAKAGKYGGGVMAVVDDTGGPTSLPAPRPSRQAGSPSLQETVAMKRAGNLYESIADPDNLRLAFINATRGKRHKPEVIAYRTHLAENLQSLRDQLLARDVDVGKNQGAAGVGSLVG